MSAAEPGVPGHLDERSRPYFGPVNQNRPADSREQRDGFVPLWSYRGHTESIKSICATGEDSFARMRVVSTDGKSVASWTELSNDDSVKVASGEHIINALAFVSRSHLVVAASADSLIVFNSRSLKKLATLSTSKKMLLQLEYNQTRDEIISGGSDGCYIWRLKTFPGGLNTSEAMRFELKLLRGLKGCSHWAGRLIWDEAAQVIVTIDGMRVKTFDASTATNLHTIRKAHESPVTVGLWMSESANIVTGGKGGLLKIWACQHSDLSGGKNGRRSRRRHHHRHRKHREKYRRLRSGLKGNRQPPAILEVFEGHSGSITGLVRHCVNSAYVVTCGADFNLRIWDVDRLAPVTKVCLSKVAVSLWSPRGPDGRSRLVCAETDGNIRTWDTCQVCHELSFDTEGARDVCYFPPLGSNAEAAAITDRNGCLVRNHGTHDPPDIGLILVRMREGLWGVMKEPSPLAPEHVVEASGGDAVGATPQKINTTSSFFFAWPPLTSVVERYSHHVLSRRRRLVLCLADSGALDIYYFGPEKGEARKVLSRKVDLHASGAIATCMCLLPATPACVAAALNHLLASRRPFDAEGVGPAHRGNGRCGDDGSNHGKYCGGRGWRKESRRDASDGVDQVVAIGTSHGGIVLVEIVVNGTTLDFLEGVFASKIFHVAFCCASTHDNFRSHGSAPGNGRSITPAKNAERLVCMGSNADGTMTIKGLAASSLRTQKFSLRLTDVPTYVRVSSRRPVVAFGYADGAVNVTGFGQDRVHDLEDSTQVAAHAEKIVTVSFSSRYSCMATGSADGCITIWNLEGHQMNTIHLQIPALAVEFMEVSGELLVSTPSGLCSIPHFRWCPMRLLISNERATRRVAAAAVAAANTSRGDAGGSGSGSDSGSGSKLLEKTTGPRERFALSMNCDDLVSSVRREGCNAAGNRRFKREGGRALGGDSVCEGEMMPGVRRNEGRAGHIDGQGSGTPAKASKRESTPPAVSGVRNVPHSPAPQECGGTQKRSNFSILDRMNAKFTSMPTSSPPPSVRATRRSSRALPCPALEPYSPTVNSPEDGEISRRPCAKYQCVGPGMAPVLRAVMYSATSISLSRPPDSSTVPPGRDARAESWAADGVTHQVEGAGLKCGLGKVAHTGTSRCATLLSRHAPASGRPQDYPLPEPMARLNPARPLLGLLGKPRGAPGQIGSRDGGLAAETTGGKKPRPLLYDLSSDQSFHVPVPPICNPPSWEKDQDAPMVIHPYRPGARVASVVAARALEGRRRRTDGTTMVLSDGRGGGTVAAIAEFDTGEEQVSVATPTAIKRGITKPSLVNDLLALITRMSPSASPPPSDQSGAFAAPPLCGSANAGGSVALATKRCERGDYSTRAATAVAPKEEGQTQGRSKVIAAAGYHSSFFPIRPLAGLRISISSRNRSQAVPPGKRIISGLGAKRTVE